jgi:TM2 domain-containing membrane protein YozV
VDNWAAILLGWVVVFVALAAYTAYVMVRGRALGRQVPDAEKPWT